MPKLHSPITLFRFAFFFFVIIKTKSRWILNPAFCAERLLKRAIDAYTSFHNDQKPARVVVHKSSRFWKEELEGFGKALIGFLASLLGIRINVSCD